MKHFNLERKLDDISCGETNVEDFDDIKGQYWCSYVRVAKEKLKNSAIHARKQLFLMSG